MNVINKQKSDRRNKILTNNALILLQLYPFPKITRHK